LPDDTPPLIPPRGPSQPSGNGNGYDPLNIADELKDSYLTYAMSVIISRALPDVRDGLKPSQRRILVAMNDLGLGPNSSTSKCAGIIGETMKRYHPHGDQSIYPTLVRMAQDWNMRYCLVHPQGNFGSIAGLPPAAHLYTEARLTPIGSEMLADLESDTVDYIDSYDGKYREPLVLPSKFPNLLVNGSDGIAVGMATDIPPHNLREVCDATIKLIDEPETTLPELLELLPGPDFPTGGIICGRQGILDGYANGRGKVTLRARADVREENGQAQIIITEVPYQQTRNRLAAAIGELVKDERIKGIRDVRDESSARNGEPVRIVVYLKRDADPHLILNQLYQYSPLEKTVSLILLALVDGRPEVLSLKRMLEEFIRHRVSVIRRRTEYQMREAKRRAHVLEGQLIAISSLDEVIAICRRSPSRSEAKVRLQGLEVAASVLSRALGEAHYQALAREIGVQASYRMTEAQAEAVVRMQLGQLAALESDEILKEYHDLRGKILSYESLLGNEQNLREVIKSDLRELRDKYGDDHRRIGPAQPRRLDRRRGQRCHHQSRRLHQTAAIEHLSHAASWRQGRLRWRNARRRFHRAFLRRLDACVFVVFHQSRPTVLDQGVRHPRRQPYFDRTRPRQRAVAKAGGKDQQHDSGASLRCRRPSHFGHAPRSGEKDSAGGVQPSTQRRHHRHQSR
jgi:DNA gyrase subunit A